MPDLYHKYGMSEGTFYAWKSKLGGMTVPDAKRRKTLEDENGKLKRLLADTMLDMSAMRGLLAKSVRACCSARQSRICRSGWACPSGGLPDCRGGRKMIRYHSHRPSDTALRTRLRDLANERRRFGCWRLFILLRREGEPSGIYRVYREEGLTVRKRRARRKAIGTRAPTLVEGRANARWSLDFMHDQFGCGRRFRILNFVDDVTRECLAAIPDTSISGRQMAQELTALIEWRG